jgi:hypothetical protein
MAGICEVGLRTLVDRGRDSAVRSVCEVNAHRGGCVRVSVRIISETTEQICIQFCTVNGSTNNREVYMTLQTDLINITVCVTAQSV